MGVLTSPRRDYAVPKIAQNDAKTRGALHAVASGISMQPVSQALGEEAYRNHLMETLNLPQLPQLVLRAGILADYGENQKIRRNIGDFVSSAE